MDLSTPAILSPSMNLQDGKLGSCQVVGIPRIKLDTMSVIRKTLDKRKLVSSKTTVAM